MKQILKKILFLLGEDVKKIPLLAILFFVVSLLDLLTLSLVPTYITLVIDPDLVLEGWMGPWFSKIGLPQEQKPLLVIFGSLLFGVFLFKSIVAIWVNYVIIDFSIKQQSNLRLLLMNVYQFLPYSDYLLRNSSNYIYNIYSLTMQFSNGVILSGLRTLSDGMIVLVIFIVLAWNSIGALILLAVLLGIMVFVYNFFFSDKFKIYGAKVNQASVSLMQGINESMNGVKEIRIFGREECFYRKVHKATQEYAHYQTRFQVLSTSPRYLLEVLLIIFVTFFVTLSILFNYSTVEILPVIGLFGVASMRLMPIINGFYISFSQFNYNYDSISKLYNDLSLHSGKSRARDNDRSLILENSFSNLHLDKVSFYYTNLNNLVLNQISLTINAGDSIGIIGASGSGKTTLVNVILGLLSPQNGEIRYNGKLLSGSLSDWNNNVAYIPQQVFLIDDTLRNNVVLGFDESEVDESQLKNALHQAKLTEVINQLPQGIDTIVGEAGVNLSGGQKQRVALARAFYYNRTILVMDEATSAIDNDTEREVLEEIQYFKGKKTVIVIAHQLETLQYCDTIYKIKDSMITKLGSYRELTL